MASMELIKEKIACAKIKGVVENLEFNVRTYNFLRFKEGKKGVFTIQKLGDPHTFVILIHQILGFLAAFVMLTSYIPRYISQKIRN